MKLWKRITCRINRYLPFFLILWSIAVSLLFILLFNHPRLQNTKDGVEVLPDSMFTVDTEIININEDLPFNISFSYKVSFGYGGPTYRFNTLDDNTYKLQFDYFPPENSIFPSFSFATIYFRKIKDKYKSFVFVHKGYMDNIPSQVFYYTNTDSTSLYEFLLKKWNISNFERVAPKPMFKKCNFKKVIIEFKKGDYVDLDFFKSIKIIPQ